MGNGSLFILLEMRGFVSSSFVTFVVSTSGTSCDPWMRNWICALLYTWRNNDSEMT